MSRSIITLTTDFGTGSYVAQMKGVILGIAPSVTIVDICHDIGPQDIVDASYVIANAAPMFPNGTIHMVVVDPGVGTERKLLYVEAGEWNFLLPDNGLLSELLEQYPIRRAMELTNAGYWRSNPSSTFHGRDILAPVAAHLANGCDVAELGIAIRSMVELPRPKVEQSDRVLVGEIVHIDRFGNLISNIGATFLDRFAARHIVIAVEGSEVRPEWVDTYGQRESGACVALLGSSSRIEIAIVNGSAADILRLIKGTRIRVIAK